MCNQEMEVLLKINENEVHTMTTSNRKPTKRDRFNTLLTFAEVQNDPALVEFIEHEIELLDKKNSAERKPTAKQTANAGIKTDIVSYMESGVQYAAADIAKNCPACEGVTVQRVSALLTQLVNDGLLVKTIDKRKSFYALA